MAGSSTSRRNWHSKAALARPWPGPGLAHYSAAKAGVIGFTKSLAREVAANGITVNCIAPGPIETPITGYLPAKQVEATRLSLPLQRIGIPAEVAPSAVLLASEPGGNLYTGQTLAPTVET